MKKLTIIFTLATFLIVSNTAYAQHKDNNTVEKSYNTVKAYQTINPKPIEKYKTFLFFHKQSNPYSFKKLYLVYKPNSPHSQVHTYNLIYKNNSKDKNQVNKL